MSQLPSIDLSWLLTNSPPSNSGDRHLCIAYLHWLLVVGELVEDVFFAMNCERNGISMYLLSIF